MCVMSRLLNEKVFSRVFFTYQTHIILSDIRKSIHGILDMLVS